MLAAHSSNAATMLSVLAEAKVAAATAVSAMEVIDLAAQRSARLLITG
jgi:hypothetical protein